MSLIELAMSITCYSTLESGSCTSADSRVELALVVVVW